MRPEEVEKLDVLRSAAERAEATAARYPQGPESELVEFVMMQAEMMREHRAGAIEGFKYGSYPDLVADLAGPPRTVPLELPAGFEPMETQQCYYNCWSLVGECDGLLYVEGYASTGLLPVSHAWCEDSSGRIIDPTWTDLGETATYWGVRFSPKFVRKRAQATGYASILDADWRVDAAALRFGFSIDANGVVIDGRLA